MKEKIAGIVAIVLLVLFVNNLPWERQSSGITDALRSIGTNQSEFSEYATDKAVSGVEGSLVGEHQVHGANWSIPNIIRHWFGNISG